MRNQALQLRDITFSYNENKDLPILSKLNFAIEAGEFISIVGSSGSGKSTIFKLIAGLTQQTSGDVFINDELLTNRLGAIGYMSQQDLLMPWRTVLQNAVLPLEFNFHNNKEKIDVKSLLKEFGLAGYEDKYPNELSGGMRQRVSFLRTTLSGSNILLLDEPFSALDAMTKLFMQEWLLKQWEKRKQTILFITHDISEAIYLSDRIYVLGETPIEQMEEVVVPLTRPRIQTDLNKPEVLELKSTLIERFRTQVKP